VTIIQLRRLRGALISAPAAHPFLLGLWFVLDVARRGIHPDFAGAVAFLAVLIAVTAAARLLLGRLFRTPVQAGLATTALLIPLLCFEEVRQFLATLDPRLAEFGVVVPMMLGFVALSVVLLRHSKADLSVLHGAMNASAIVFVVWVLFPFIKEANATSIPDQPRSIVAVPQGAALSSTGASSSYPDIYYILLDAYTAPKSLSRFWGYENSEFVSALERRGFYVAGDSKSRYTSTVQSMASTLNMDTLTKEEELFPAIRNNLLVRYLQAKHYTVENLSPFDLGESPAYYTYFTDVRGANEGFSSYFFHTGPGIVIASFLVERLPEENLRILSRLTALSGEVAATPRFVYAHLMSPHGPFGFDRDGSLIPLIKRGRWNSLPAYLNQLIGTNRLLLPVVDTILARSSRDPIIIIQGDHGSRIIPGAENRNEAHTIFNAYHLPSGGARLLTPSISPVNSFRVVLKYYFDEDVPLADAGEQNTR